MYPDGEFPQWFCCAAPAAGSCSGSTGWSGLSGKKRQVRAAPTALASRSESEVKESILN